VVVPRGIASTFTPAPHRTVTPVIQPAAGNRNRLIGRDVWFWPPVGPEAKRIRVIVSTLWEAAWADADIPGR
jgi:hypothetical protein